MCGHLKHATLTTLPMHVALDVLLATVFVAVAIIAFRSTIKHPKMLSVLLTLIYLDHILLANGAGYLFILIDAPIMTLIIIRCFKRLRESRAQHLTA
jgi:hypothetical protein